ncbi:MAG: hypothetical protein JW712_03645 [Dehalococcoidales bacterium]|nr:hypothetical protein [Dehalococcoidales bacterium]
MTLELDLVSLPGDERMTIPASLELSPEIHSLLQLAAADAGLGDIEIVFAITVEKTNISNRDDIKNALVTMVAVING